jgi:pimeloyl-ACP methyl ester carboxylesterase
VIRHRQTLEPEQRDPVFPWIGGELYVTQGANEYKFDLNDYEEIKVAFNYDVKGLGGLARSYGLGVPLILVRSQLPQGQEFHPRILKMLGSGPSEALEMKSSYAASVLVKLDSSFVARSGSSAPMSMTFEVFDPSRTSQIEIGQRCVPLEADLSSPLAYSLGASAGYSGLGALFNPGENQGAAGLFLLQPYDAEKIPVIFVHGLMSAPITWVALINDLLADPELRQRCQFWFFRYPTGNPVLLSASLLRDTLGEAYRVLDPSDSHPAMDHMVICGHSMGGLLTRMQLLDGGDRIWTRISETPLDSLGLEEDQKQLLQHIFYFEQVPFLTRAVFLATPHRGADMANSFVGSLGRWLITLPNRVLQVTVDLGRELGDRLRNPLGRRLQEEGSSGITSLAPDSFLATTISEFPLPADVAVHSILGDEHEAGRIGGSDGLVDYESSHVEGVQSELVLESGHNVQKHPLAAVELRRILHLHLDEYDAALAAAHRVLEEPPTTSSAASVAEPEIPK